LSNSESAEQPSVVKALNLVMRDVTKVAKNEENTMQHFRFRGIDATTKAIAPALREHGVVVVPVGVEDYTYNVEEFGRNATKMGHVMVKVRYRWYGPQGDYIDTMSVGEATDAGDKCTAKAMSVAFRTCILQALCLPTDDPDPDSESYERSSKNTPVPVPRAPRAPRTPVKPWEQRVAEADSADELNALWLEAAAATGLTDDMKKLLYKRRDEIDLKSAPRQTVGAGAN